MKQSYNGLTDTYFGELYGLFLILNFSKVLYIYKEINQCAGGLTVGC